MTTQKSQLGQLGEETAVAFLKQQGYLLVEKNFQNKIGEIAPV